MDERDDYLDAAEETEYLDELVRLGAACADDTAPAVPAGTDEYDDTTDYSAIEF